MQRRLAGTQSRSGEAELALTILELWMSITIGMFFFDLTFSPGKTNLTLMSPTSHECFSYFTSSVFVATWNVAGRSPPSNLSIDDWLHASPPADIYVLG